MEDERVNVVPVDQWVQLEESDFQEDKDHEEQWADVECQEAVELQESQVPWEPRDPVV